MGIYGGLVAYATAALVLAVILGLPGRVAGLASMDRRSGYWFLASAVESFLANLFRFSALALAPVTIVVPMMRIAVLFQLAFNWLLNRSLESFEPRVLGGLAVSMVGAALLVI